MLSPTARTRALALAWMPTARGLPLPTLAGAAALAIAPTLVVVLQRGSDHTGALIAGSLVLGAMAGYSVDDPAEETVSASPTGLARRRLLRLSAIALGVAATALLLVVVAGARAELTAADLGRRLAELVAASGLAAATAGTAQRRGVPGAAHGGAVTALIGVLLVAALAERFSELPSLMGDAHHERWWWVAIVGWAVGAWSSRDPMR